MIEIVNVKDFDGGIEAATKYIHGKWGSEKNYSFYEDAIIHSSLPNRPLPKFYLLLKAGKIIGCYGLIINDFISRHDLYPWFACLYIESSERGAGYGSVLMAHAADEALRAGFSTIYLTTDHDGYYEKYGWQRIENGYELDGSATRIYKKEIRSE